jgi:thymidylate synthase (FAD)
MKFWVPEEVRTAPKNAKQGTGPAMEGWVGHLDAQTYWKYKIRAHNDISERLYESAIGAGVAPEQARAVLPQSMYVYWTWTGSLLAWLHLIRERTHHSAQTETRQWISPIIMEVATRFPAAWLAVTKHTNIEIPNVIEAEKEGKVLTAANVIAAESTPI